MWGERDAYFWSTQRGAELDLLLLRKGRRVGFEFKCTDAPTLTRSIHVALEDVQSKNYTWSIRARNAILF